MTGYGRAEGNAGNRQIIVEIKSLNGKQFEISNRFSPFLRAYEPNIRLYLNNALKRGTVDISITIKQDGASKPMMVNTELAQYYFNAMKTIADELGMNWEEEQKKILPTLMRMPEIVAIENDTLPEKDWLVIQELIKIAAQDLIHHRGTEGDTIGNDLKGRITNIENYLQEIIPLEEGRISRIKERITDNLEEFVGNGKWDENRMEQELIFYIEKIDISEEKQRLGAHCTYFKQLMEGENKEGIGKKLGFLLQEIGREINTLGSKANDAIIQKIVINMKDELEKAKEQILNVL